MTREEAKNFLIDISYKLGNMAIEYLTEKDGEKMREAIKALEQEPCEDAISRREAIKKFTYNYKGERIPDYDCDNFPVQIAMKTVKEMLRELPPVNSQPKTGHWIEDEYEMEVRCSECGEDNDECSKYCPNCGAKMVEPQESEE